MEVPPEINARLEDRNRRREEIYSPSATRDGMYCRRYRRQPEDPLIRPPFTRDADRIVHSKAYARYIDKTQVFYLVEHDHITHRALHVQLVSRVGRTIGRCLGLNEDLVEAIALGHDIGHAPYGHLGESLLNDLGKKHGLWGFRHNEQGVHFLDTVEDCNLTVQVLDGILCHNGEQHDQVLTIQGEAVWESLDEKIGRVRRGEDIAPCTPEGCVVRCADSISYLGRDLQDALEVDLIGEEDIERFPGCCREFFGVPDTGREGFRDINRLVLDRLIRDVIASSGEDGIGFSGDASACVEAFRAYNSQYIYQHPDLVRQQSRVQRMFEILYTQLLDDLVEERRNSPVYRQYLDQPWVERHYAASAVPEQVAMDFIAGMTDRYCEWLFRRTVLPEKVRQSFRKDSA